MFALIFLLFNLPLLHEQGYTGRDVRIAIIDAGFFRANDPTVFPQEQIAGVYDLIAEDLAAGDPATRDTFPMFVDPSNTHGTSCLSTMLYRDSTFTGTAPDATYYLIRSEDNYAEYRGEVTRLARAFRLADSLDVDIVTVSLGYTVFDDTLTNYRYEDMNGSSEAAQAALELARHGRLVCVAMGNDARKPWHYISTPADADSILSVGAVRADSTAADFSSFGPTADGRLKPEVSALGHQTTVYMPNTKDAAGAYVGALIPGNGTSFATPEIAGLAACLWQAMPELSAEELRQRIIESCHRYGEWDAQRGYGIPDAWYALTGTHAPTGLYDNQAASGAHHATRGYKLLQGGRLLIRRGQQTYDLLGHRVK